MADPTGITLAAFGDTHCGSTEGLMRRAYQFHDANVKPNPRQRAIWRVFEQYADEIAQRRRGRRLIVVVNGDLVDGDHHDTHQLVTRKSSEQQRIFIDAWDYFAQAVGFGGDDHVYLMRGTDLNGTHGNQDAADEIGRDIGAIPETPPTPDHLPEYDDHGNRIKAGRAVDGWYPWQNLTLDINGQRVWVTHHPPAGKGSRASSYGNAIRSWLRSYQAELDARRRVIPRYVLWSHYHTYWSEVVRLDNGTPAGPVTEAVILPALQGKTDYVYQRQPGRMPTTIGGWWAQIDPDGVTYCRAEYAELETERKAVKI